MSDDDFDFFESNADDTDPNPEVVEATPALRPAEATPRVVRATPHAGSVIDWQRHFENGVKAGRNDYRNILKIVLGDSEFTLRLLERIDRILEGKETPALGGRRRTGG